MADCAAHKRSDAPPTSLAEAVRVAAESVADERLREWLASLLAGSDAKEIRDDRVK